ncbi:hypothetical protein CRI77_06425 [Mycolicibacterium duvalii]|uniref:Uncharacterized protein n=1 Tax=Mycolicibacterium duvalii TaxID=39688 RepID=A0A7I7K8G1_9MYCO|nr:hypothetical protein CRI77_06425 [Mycolicibacterium duvalii]BBX19791.1 hypothetical protein MDUV_46510 [Mycolicibacterium duvalii]
MPAIRMEKQRHRGARDVSSQAAIDAIWSDAEETVREEVPALRRRWIESWLESREARGSDA